MPSERDVAAGVALLVLCAAAGAQQPDVSRRDALIHLLRHDCGSCHGMTLNGGLGPALTPQSLGGKSEASLAITILDGRPGTPMPPWRGQLSDADARWLARALKTGTFE